MMKQMTVAAVALFVLAGCGTAGVPGAATQSAGMLEAQGKKAATDRPVQVFDRLIGMLSVHEESGEVMFEFGTKGLIFSDATRKNPLFTVNGEFLDGGYGVMAGADGKLYIPQMVNGERKGYYLLGSYEVPKDLKHIQFRQKCEIKFEMGHSYKLKKPLNPMAHIQFEIDLKSAPKLVESLPQPLRIR